MLAQNVVATQNEGEKSLRIGCILIELGTSGR